MLSHTIIHPQTGKEIIAETGYSEHMVYFDKIYSANVELDVQAEDNYSISAECFEKEPGQNSPHEIVINGNANLHIVSQELYSLGGIKICINNPSCCDIRIRTTAVFTCYPVVSEGSFRCNDERLNKIYDVCKWTTQINRQSYHLDSPLHQEPLACTGDYYIESLIEAVCFGDMRLAEFDIVKTAELIVAQKGRMFHTTYSLIWVLMLESTYLFTGDAELIYKSEKALEMLMSEFKTYVGDTGLIEKPVSYMFVDWLVVDGISMHHPPKCLGQTVMCCFYYAALCAASRLLEAIGKSTSYYIKAASALKAAINSRLYDTERGLYFDGLNTQYSSDYCYLPENTEQRYYSVHSNALAVLFDICPAEKRTEHMEKVLNDPRLIQPQPYFMHFVIEAVEHAELFQNYGIKLLNRWKPVVEEFDKGLAEGWYKPEEGYHFDHSHAWGGTPAYQLPIRFSGLKILEPGYCRISLSPRLLGLDYVDLKIPTPYGFIHCVMKKGLEPQIDVPKQIEWHIEK